MIHGLSDVRRGFETRGDVVVVGTGAGGAVAAANLASAGLRTIVLEAGPQVTPDEMTRDAPRFMARYYWEAGLRQIGGTAQIPSLAARCLGGSTVVNSAIMLKLPDWVRREWVDEDGLAGLLSSDFDDAFERVFARTRTTPTPLTVMGRRNDLAREALEAAGIPGAPLPRAVLDCQGCADCLTGCAGGHKQSTDRSYLPGALSDGAEVFTCAQVDRVLMEGSRAVGVEGRVVDPDGRRTLAPFRVMAPRVVIGAGALATPVILQRSGIRQRGRVGGTLYCHIGGAAVGVMDEPVEPWFGATQGYGAIHPHIPGMKFECLWGPTSVLAIRWGGLGEVFMNKLGELRHATVIAVVYRAKVRGRVKARRDGLPNAKVWVPSHETRTVLRGVKQAADGLLDIGARYTHASVYGCKEEMTTKDDTAMLLNPAFGPKNVPMTGNHVFGSCRMSASAKRGACDPNGAVYGVDGVTVCDASLFPSPSAVNPQATVMALSDVISRRLAELG